MEDDVGDPSPPDPLVRAGKAGQCRLSLAADADGSRQIMRVFPSLGEASEYLRKHGKLNPALI